MAIPATQMRPGMIIKHNNDLHLVFTVEHRTPGNLRAFIQAKLRNIRTGAMFEHRFRSADPIDKITVDEIPMEYLYQDGDSFGRQFFNFIDARGPRPALQFAAQCGVLLGATRGQYLD